ncbi:proprotein convertase subtilisin/kexin type 5-like [Argopecten irradians]|uniref:proprotein convertase subtilisin/kexin type 5-like n=1 Tax=Argopecten irradians TaxID=31199 RepID=UPI00371E96CA
MPNLRGISDCPSPLLQVMFKPTCLENCPADIPFEFMSMCLTFCPYGYTEHDNNITCRAEKSDLNFDLCGTTVCSKETPLCYSTQCMSECPNGTFPKGRKCLQSCADALPFVLNDSCVSKCPDDKPYDENGYCVSACTSSYFLYNRKCLSSCPDQTFVYRSTCVENCPPEAEKSVSVWNKTICVSDCPSYTVFNGSQCELICPIGQDYLWNGSCVSDCPEIFPYTHNVTRSFSPYQIAVCTDSCPSSTYLEENHCESNCPYILYESNIKCVSSCPDKLPFTTGESPPFVCVSEQCPSDNYIFNNTCVKVCPASHPFKENRVCLPKCRSRMVGYEGTCLFSCPDVEMDVNNGQCECPNSRPFLHQISATRVECRVAAVCPKGEFTWHNNCFYQCPDYTFFFNFTCLDKCPSSHPFKYRSDRHGALLAYECVSNCPENTFTNGDFCYDHCVNPFVGFRGNYTCLEKCPESDRWLSATTTIANQLAFVCSENCSAPRLMNSDQCLLSCPDDKPFVVNQTCVKQCPVTLNLKTTHAHGIVCSKVCPENYIQDSDTCMLRCSAGKVIIDDLCVDVKYCVHEYQYIEYSKHGTICRKRCLDNQFVDNIRCVTSCPLFALGQYCVNECPSYQKFTREQNSSTVNPDKQCYEDCPSKTYANGTKCIAIDCPQKYVSDSRNCVSVCPKSHPYVKHQYVCVSTCEDDYVIADDNTCIEEKHCHQETGYFVYSRRCVNACPPGTFVNYVNNGCILSSVVYLLIVVGVLGIISMTAALVWFYYYRQRKNCQTCFTKMQERCSGDTPLLREDVLSDGYAMTDMVTDSPGKTDVTV